MSSPNNVLKAQTPEDKNVNLIFVGNSFLCIYLHSVVIFLDLAQRSTV